MKGPVALTVAMFTLHCAEEFGAYTVQRVFDV